ncbi:MAG: HAD hydrolase-like protein, partial [Prevotella sp.]|nr:HAD hydrolase-like protein [Prevotella sp.]
SGASPLTTCMIGDNLQTDITGAHNAGLDTILFNRWNVEPTSIPTHTVTTLREIMQIL